MTATATTTAIREGFRTVTPYLRVRAGGLVEFLARAFAAEETLSGRGSGGGMHREVRIGDSMLMIGEGGGSGVMPVTPMAFHIFVEDADAGYARALEAGATSLGAPADRPYGERSSFVVDPFGNHWYIASALGPHSVAAAVGTVTPCLFARDAASYLEFLTHALGATEEARHAEGTHLRYARLRVGDSAIEFGEGEPMPGSFLLYVADADAAYQRALDAGAASVMAMGDYPYGRSGGVVDTAGNRWFFTKPI